MLYLGKVIQSQSLLPKVGRPVNNNKLCSIMGSRPKTHYSRHCERATTEPVKGEIRGIIPAWLQGTLIRNGAGIQKIGSDEYKHVFDGLSVLHRYHIENGQVTYTSRPLESDTYNKNMAANRIVVGEFGTASVLDPCKTVFQRLQTTFSVMRGKESSMTDNCSVNVAYYGDQLYAMTETQFIRRIDPEDLRAIGGKTDLKKFAAVNHATAHPHILPDGTVLNMGSCYDNKKGPQYCVFKIPPSFGQEDSAVTGAKVVAEIPTSSVMNPCYYHSFGLAGDKIIFIESPLRISLCKLLTSPLRAAPFASALHWDPSLKTRFHVASMKDVQPNRIVYEADPMFTFHHINAYEQDGQLVVDVVAYIDGSVVTAAGHDATDNVKEQARSYARRFVLPLAIPKGARDGQNLVTLKNTTAKAIKTGEGKIHLEPESLSDVNCELPKINYNYNGMDYNYFYCVALEGLETSKVFEPETIIKTDIRNKQVKRWTERGMNPSEPVFVANPNGKTEDDGVVLSALSHADEPNAATLLILDGKTLEEAARVSFKTAGAFTTTFHGQWAGQNEKVHLY